MSMKWNGGSYLTEGGKYYTATQVDSLVAGLVTGSHTHTNYQPINANLTALSGLTGATDRLAYFTGAGTMQLTTLTTLGRTLIGGATSTAMRSTLGLVIGTDVQAYSSLLTSFAGLTGSGYPKRATDGTWSFDATIGNYQPLNANLTAVSGIGSGTGYVRFTSANTITMDTNSYQPTSTNLSNLVALSTSGFVKKTGANTWGIDTASYQPLDSDLTAIAGLTGAGYPKRDSLGGWTLDAGTGSTGNYQPLDANLTALAGIGTNTGYVRYTSANTITMDPGPFQAGSATLTNLVALTTNGFIKKTGANSWGVDTGSYQPLDSDLTAIAGLTGAGFAKRASDGSWSLDTASYQLSNTQLNSISSLASSSTAGYLKRNSTGAYSIDSTLDSIVTGLSSLADLGIANNVANNTYYFPANTTNIPSTFIKLRKGTGAWYWEGAYSSTLEDVENMHGDVTYGTLRKGYRTSTDPNIPSKATIYPVKTNPVKTVTTLSLTVPTTITVLAKAPSATWWSNNGGAWKTWWVCDTATNTPANYSIYPGGAIANNTVYSFGGSKQVLTIPAATSYGLTTNNLAYWNTVGTNDYVPTMVTLTARSFSSNVDNGQPFNSDGGGDITYIITSGAPWNGKLSVSGTGPYSYYPSAASGTTILVGPSISGVEASGKLRFREKDTQYGVTTWHSLPSDVTLYLTLVYMSFSHNQSIVNYQDYNNIEVTVTRFHIDDSGHAV